MPEPLLERVLAAYGGRARWTAATAVEDTFTLGGLLLRLKGTKGLENVNGSVVVHEPRVRITPVDERGSVGVLEGHDVRLETPEGEVMASRPNARSKFPYGRRLFRWDLLDLLYFAGYTQWTYMAFPALLLRDDVRWTQIGETTLEGRFPPHLPTHCEVQRFHFDPESALLRYYEYTADIFGPWAKGGHVIAAHRTWDGVPFPSTRRVWSRRRDGTPREGGRYPLMMFLDVHEAHIV
jgi:hypothetical protein